MRLELARLIRDARGIAFHDRHVLLVLATYADSKGECYPSVTRLAEDLERSTRSISAALNRMSGMGVLTVMRRGQRSNLYRFEVVRLRELGAGFRDRQTGSGFPVR